MHPRVSLHALHECVKIFFSTLFCTPLGRMTAHPERTTLVSCAFLAISWCFLVLSSSKLVMGFEIEFPQLVMSLKASWNSNSCHALVVSKKMSAWFFLELTVKYNFRGQVANWFWSQRFFVHFP